MASAKRSGLASDHGFGQRSRAPSYRTSLSDPFPATLAAQAPAPASTDGAATGACAYGDHGRDRGPALGHAHATAVAAVTVVTAVTIVTALAVLHVT